MTRAFYRSYVHNNRRGKQVTRLHIVREDGRFPGRQGECGTTGWGVTKSQPVVIDPMPAEPPAGLRWCPMCLGKLAERCGLLAGLGRQLAETTTARGAA